jgi:hypothetical protein
VSTGNPNVEVGAESGPLTSRTNSITSFSDIEEADLPPPGATAKKAPEKKPSGEVPKKKDEPKKGGKEKTPADVDEDDGEDAEPRGEGDKKPADKKSEPKPEPEKPKADAKPKSHKGRSGENQLTIPSDTVFGVPVDGKKEDVSFQELVDNYSGKQNYDRKYNDLARELKSHQESVKTLNDNITQLFQNAEKDPEEAWDWLAEMTKQDPVELKGSMMKKQVDQSLEILRGLGVEIPDDIEQRLEGVFQKERLNWRERKLTRAEKNKERTAEQTAAQQKLSETKERYGLDDERWETARRHVAEFLKTKGVEGEVPLEAVVHFDRHQMAVATIEDAVPHLAKREDFAHILQETTRDLVLNPKMTKEQLRATLIEVFGSEDEDAERQRRLSQKARERKDQVPRSAESARGTKPYLSFDDIDD